jgi:hypothetical protein
MGPCGADYSASLYHLATDVSALARHWRSGEFTGFFDKLVGPIGPRTGNFGRGKALRSSLFKGAGSKRASG